PTVAVETVGNDRIGTYWHLWRSFLVSPAHPGNCHHVRPRPYHIQDIRSTNVVGGPVEGLQTRPGIRPPVPGRRLSADQVPGRPAPTFVLGGRLAHGRYNRVPAVPLGLGLFEPPHGEQLGQGVGRGTGGRPLAGGRSGKQLRRLDPGGAVRQVHGGTGATARRRASRRRTARVRII